MALIAVVTNKNGKILRKMPLHKGANLLNAEADATVSVIDEKSGQVVGDVQIVRNGSEVVVTPSSTYSEGTQYAYADVGGAATDYDPVGGGAPDSSGGTGNGGGDNSTTFAVLGGLLAAGGIAVAAGGGGGGGSKRDTTAPAAPAALALAAADDTGTSSSDRITRLTSGLTVTGTAEANATVTLREGTTTLGTGTADASGNFSIDVALAAGAHNITAIATDAAGNASVASTALAITVDATAPTLTITSSATTLQPGQAAVITFTFGEAPVGFDASDITVTGAVITNLAVSPTDPKVYTATLTAAAGAAASVAVSVAGGAITDVAGNASTAATPLSIAIDTGTSGQAIDGYIANALVFRDADNDGIWDRENFTDANNDGVYNAGEAFTDANADGRFTAEFSTTTDAQGNFSGLLGSGRIVLTPLVAGNGNNLTTDISTGMAYTGRLAAPEGSTVVTPLTTIIEAIAGADATAEQVAAAEAQVKTALGIDPAVDLTAFDPIATAATSSDGEALANAVAVQKAGVQVANILAVMASASTAAGATDGGQAGVDAAVSVIATQIGAGATVSLSDPALVSQIVQAVAETSGDTAAGAAIAAQADALGASLANINSVVEQATGDNVIDTFAAIITAQIVAQDTLATDTAQAVATESVVDSGAYQGAALTDKIDDAATQVEVIVPPVAPPAGTLGAPDRPTVDDGARVSAAEAADGIVVTITYGASTGVAAGDKLSIAVGGVEVKSVVLASGDIPASGTTGTITVALSAADLGDDGTKSITAGFVSAAGVAGAVSLPAVLTLDTAVAAPAGLSLAAADDSGASNSDRITSQTSALTISGTAEANATVTLLDGATVLGTAIADGSGGFSLDVTLAAGAHSVTATATDTAGNVSAASSVLSVTVDTAAPTAPTGLSLAAADDSGSSNSDRITNQTSGLTISGTAEANATVTLFDGATVLGTVVADGGGAFSLDVALGAGVHNVTATATDAAGNVSVASSSLGITVNTTAPAAPTGLTLAAADDSGVSNVDGITSQTSGLTISGTAAANATVTLFDGATVLGTAVADGGGAFSLDVALTAGAHSITATATDMAGNVGVASLALGVTVDTTAPAAPLGLALAAEDDSGTSNSDGVTSRTSGLTISGTAEANASVTLFDGATVLGTTIANGSGAFSLDVSLTGGVHEITAKATDAAGNVSIASSALAITVDTTAPAAPLGLALSDGPIVTAGEAADGAIVTGTTQAGTTVTVTLTNGEAVLVKQAEVSGSSFSVALSAGEIAQLGEGYVKYSAVSTDAAGNVGPQSATSQYFYTTQQIVDTNARLDGAGTRAVAETEDAGIVGVTPLSGGGFVVHWVGDLNGDGDGDSLAVQRFNADGSKQGGVTLLQGIDQDLANNAGEDVSYDLRALDDGGYALTYALSLEEGGRFATGVATAANPIINFTLVGRPNDFFIQSAPSGATYFLAGMGTDGLPKSVVLTKDGDSGLVINDAILSQFLMDNRLTLQVRDVPVGQSVELFVGTLQDVRYDPDGAVRDVSSSFTVLADGLGVISTTAGRAEALHIDGFTPTGTAPAFVAMSIITPQGGNGIDLTGITGATLLPNGVIRILNPTPDANGDYLVPPSILDQLGTQDAHVVLVVGGLVAGSTITGTVSILDPIAIPEGVFVQSFNADGVALGDAGVRLDGASVAVVNESDDGGIVGVTPLSGGGFVVHWVGDVNGDGDGDSLAVQRFNADGSTQGGVTLLQGIDQDLVNNAGEDVSFDLRALNNGGYALTYALSLEEGGYFATLNASVTGQVLSLGLVGRPTEISVQSAPPGTSFALAGIGNDGLPTSVALTVVDSQIIINQAILDQFLVDNRLSLQVSGVPGGQSASIFIETLQDVRYDPDAALHDVSTSFTVLPNGFGVIRTTAGRPESLHIDGATYANGTGPASVAINILTPQGGNGIDLTGIPGATRLPNGVIQIFNPTPDANGDYLVPPSILAQLDTQDAQAFLVVGGLAVGSTLTGTVSILDPIAIPEGVFVQTFNADGVALGDAGVRLDATGVPVVNESDDGGIVGVTPLSGGGFVVHWVGDVNGDGDGDSLAVQRFNADGSKQGAVTLLQGISQNLIENAGEDVSYDLRALDNGGYALTYLLGLEEGGRLATVSSAALTQVSNISIVGRPTEIFVQSAPLGTTFTLAGMGNDGLPKSVPLTVIDGEIVVNESILDQFLIDNRLNLQVTGVPAMQSATVFIETAQDVRYDPDAALRDVSTSFTVLPNGVGVVGTGAGRPEVFHIDGATYGTGSSTVSIQLTTAENPGWIDLSGAPGAFVLPNGSILIPNLTPDANGDYHVPASILDQLGTQDAQALLVVTGLVAGTTITGTASVLDPIAIPEGVFVQTFDANGVAVSSGLALTGTAGADLLVGDFGNDVLDGGVGPDILTGGLGADLFVLEAPGGQSLSLADLITDFQQGIDHIRLPGGVQFSDVQIAQGDPATNGASATESLIIHGASGDILARLAGIDAATLAQTSFG